MCVIFRSRRTSGSSAAQQPNRTVAYGGTYFSFSHYDIRALPHLQRHVYDIHSSPSAASPLEMLNLHVSFVYNFTILFSLPAPGGAHNFSISLFRVRCRGRDDLFAKERNEGTAKRQSVRFSIFRYSSNCACEKLRAEFRVNQRCSEKRF